MNSSTGTETVLYSFCPAGGSCTDGWGPGLNCCSSSVSDAALIRDGKGNIYGTTALGGSGLSNCFFSLPCGVVFELDKAGQETVLYNFCSQPSCADGLEPLHPLIRDTKGNLYGTTLANVFKIDTTGAETVLHNFTGYPTDGLIPATALMRDGGGNIYGTTYSGGAYGDGVAFRLDTTTGTETLYSFPGGMQGQSPYGGLIRDVEGNFYGTTTAGGTSVDESCTSDGCGTVFKLDAHGRESVLYSFTGANGDGANPSARLIRDAEGNLYGTTNAGGAHGSGTVFKLDNAGQETVLYSFCSLASCADGQQPTTGLVQDAAGNLYGTTFYGGANGSGVVFKIAP